MKRFSGQIELTKMKVVILEKKGQSGMIRGVFIPIEANALDEFLPGRVAIPINIVVNDELDKYDNNGFIGQQVSSKKYKNASDSEKEEFKKLPILGNFKDFSGNSENKTTTIIEGDDGTDDLPF